MVVGRINRIDGGHDDRSAVHPHRQSVQFKVRRRGIDRQCGSRRGRAVVSADIGDGLYGVRVAALYRRGKGMASSIQTCDDCPVLKDIVARH
ncbi:hypothetical protein SDC9_190060 [bioreactor metagenome]|uniref:Uncharacterized protein n=1 Tax=bioreactor metagenome TaxID=1076179 RepID=A0A645I4U4_9ZZZZ